MFCQDCRRNNRDDARFCDRCGSALPIGRFEPNHRAAGAIGHLAVALDCLDVPAFVTDDSNRMVQVNQTFARLIGDPVSDRLPPHLRFIIAAMLGPYRERFPRRYEEVSRCLPGLREEVSAGRLAASTLWYIEQALALDDRVRPMRDGPGWDGTVVIRDDDGRMVQMAEQVVPFAAAPAFHVSLWVPVEGEARTAEAPTATTLLTARQIEVARSFASGLTSRGVGEEMGISWRTARDHLEEIYSRLEVHSRAELTARLVREGLV